MTRSRDVSKGATRNEFIYTATATQTTFSGNDDNSNSLSYTVGQIDVFMNGARLAPADFTATNGTSVVLGAAAAASDIIQVNAFGTFSVSDVLAQRTEFDYTATAGQTTFSGSDNGSNSLSYTAGRIDVYLNGSHLNDTDDYVATNGTSVVLQAGAEVGDLLKVVNHGTVNLVSNILSSDLDLNGNKLDLDADADTSIHASTDDQIDIEIAGADDFTFTANDFTALSGSVISTDTINETTSGSGVTIDSVICKDGAIDVNGTSDGIVLDADADTTISADTDDQLDIKVGGTDRFSIASTGKVTSTSTGAASNFDIINTDDGTLGPDLTLYHNSTSPADNDTVGLISFAGNDGGGTKNTYAQIRGGAIDVSDTEEDGMIQFFTQQAGTLEEKMRIVHSARVGINTTSIQGTLHVDSEFDGTFGRACIAASTADPTGDSSNQLIVCAFTGDNTVTNATFISFRDSGGEIGHITATSGTAVAYNTTSDYRLKENVSYSWDATTRLKQLKPVIFNFIADDTDTVIDGFLAHEVGDVVPNSVTGTKDGTRTVAGAVKRADGSLYHENVTEADWTAGKADGTYTNDTTWSETATVPDYQGIDHSKLVPLLVKTVQEQQVIIENLQSRVTTLEG